MIEVNPQYIKNAQGENELVVLTKKEFDNLLDELEELEDIRLYDEAKKEDDNERIPFSEYLENRKKKNG